MSRRVFRGRQSATRECFCGEQCILYSWRESDTNPGSEHGSCRTYVYIHPSTGSIDKRDEATGVAHYAPEADGAPAR